MKSAYEDAHHYPDDDEDLEEFEEENSFEGGNEIFELRSQVNSLKIEKQKLIIEHQAVMASIQTKNQQLTQANNQFRRQNSTLTSKLKNSEEQCDEIRRTYETLRQQFQSVARKTADFRHSPEDRQGSSLVDPSDIINDLLQRDKIIEELQSKLESLTLKQGSQGQKNREQVNEQENQKLEGEIKSLKKTIEQLKRKEISYKRQYEGMLQSKEQIIKKMAAQNDDYSRKIMESKDKIINELRKQLQDSLGRIEQIKLDNKEMGEKLVQNEADMGKVKMQFRKKQEKMFQSKEVQKEDLTKQMNQKLKKYLRDKQDELVKSEDKIYELENSILLLKQEVGKQKAQITSREQLTSYLETSNKQYEESKKKLQNLLYEREKQLGQLRQKYFSEVSELKKTIIHERASMEQRVSEMEEQVSLQKIRNDKMQDQIREYQNDQEEELNKIHMMGSKECEKLRRQKDELNEQLLILQDRYREKSDKLLNVEKKFRKEYEERLHSLQSELIKERQKAREQKQGLMNENIEKKTNLQGELQKLKNVLELVEIDKGELQSELKKMRQDKIVGEKERLQGNTKMRDIQRKLKQKEEDYRYLEISYDELKEKYRNGVKDLEDQIHSMTQQFLQERRKAERRKNQSQDSEGHLSIQIKNYKAKIQELQNQLDNIKTNKVEDAQCLDLKIQKLTNQLSIVTKQKDAALKLNERLSKDKGREGVYEQEKVKFMEYIRQLQENNQILNHKLEIFENKDRKNSSGFSKEMKNLKIEYSESLKETNILLQKYKKLEEVHQQTWAEMNYIKAEHDMLNKKYIEIYREKNKLCDELNSSYDQINKLNLVLMSKEEQISRSKTVHCPQFETKPNFYSSRETNLNLNTHSPMNINNHAPISPINRNSIHQIESNFIYRRNSPYN